MKKKNPPKKLRFFKKTIAHINHEQMYTARGGDIFTRLFCTDTGTDSKIDCWTDDCGDSNNKPTQICG